MRKLRLITLLLCLITGVVWAQCPTASFSLPDSVCAGSQYTITNSSSGVGSLSYNWDFHVGDANSTPTASLIGSFPSLVSSSYGTELIYEGGNYYQFVQNNSGSLVRFDYGNSLTNSPTSNVLGNIDGLLGQAADIRFLKEGNDWYAFINCWNNRIVKLTFGNSITNLPTATQLSLTNNGLDFPYHLTAAYDGINYYVLCANLNNSTITVANLGTTMSNNNAICTNFPIKPNGFPTGICVNVDCDQWYAFATYTGNTDVSQVSFGNSLSNPTPVVTSLNLSLSVGTSREIETFREGGKWYAIMNSFGGNNVNLLNFGSSLSNINVTVQNIGSVGQLSSGDNIFALNITDSDLSMISVNSTNGNISRIKFQDIGTISPSTSTNTNPSVILNGSGWTKISLSVLDASNNLANVLEDSVYINPIPSVVFTTSPACRNTDVEFNDNSTITIGNIVNNNWNFGDNTTTSGISVTHIYTIAGSYNVVLTTTSDKGCVASDSILLNVSDNPIADFTFTNDICSLSDVIFTDISTAAAGSITNWLWSFGDTFNNNTQNPNHAYANDGIYNAQLVVTQTNGCKDSIIKAINVIPTPQSGFSIFNTCINETTNFINTTSINGSSTLTYNWDFGDSNSSSLTNPTNTYPNLASNYDVKLITIASNGCTDTIQNNIRIGEKPIPNFAVNKDTACVGNIIQFTNTSTIASGDIISKYYWDFGDLSIDSVNVNTTHEYLIPGIYTVSLKAFSPTDCDSTFSKVIVVIDSPTSNFTSTDVCLGFNTLFTDISTTPTGSVLTNWNWNFGDTNTSNLQNTNNTYLQAGIYNVTLVVTNSAGCYDSTTKSVLVYSLPQPNFGFTKACTDKEVAFTDSSTVNNSTIAVWTWNFGDNTSPSSTQNTNHIYSAAAAYPVTLTTTTAYGCVDSLTKYILVDQSPQFNITASDTCFRLSNKFTYSPIGAPLPTANFLWNFGDSTFAFQSNPNHLYTQPGSYPVSLLVTDLNTGCNAQINDTVSVYALPKSEFSIQNSCINDSLRFIDLSTTSSGAITSWKWVLGTYGNSMLQNPAIVINVADSFLVKQVVTSNFGCKDSSNNYAVVYPLPSVSFTQNVSYGGPPLIVNFTNTSNANQYEWNFGDGSSLSTQLNPTHVYNAIGNYNTTLVATSSKGCIDSSSTTITVLNPALDLALEAISYTETNGLWEIKCKVRNLGNLDVNSFTLSAQLEGKSQISETIENLVLVAGQSKDFIFSSKFLADDSDNPNYLCVKVVDVNAIVDDNRSNDNRCVTTSKEYEVFEAYPNPFNQNINIGINAPNLETVSISILSIEGKKIVNDSSYELQKGFNTISIENLHLLSGIYFLQIFQGENITVKKLLKN